MNLDSIFRDHGGRTIKAGIVGAGEFGRSFMAQARLMPNLTASALADIDPSRGVSIFRGAGIAEEAITIAEDADQARKAQAAGNAVVVRDGALLAALDLDVVIDATGEPNAAARNALAAIDSKKSVVMVTKECEIVVGSILADRAKRNGVVYTLADGDQPSLLIGLIAWAKLMGFEIVMAGKATEYDFVWDIEAGTMTCHGKTAAARDFAKHWSLPETGIAEGLRERIAAVPDLIRITVPDLCEMGIVANATGLLPDRPEMHAPPARTVELPSIFRPQADGGILAKESVLDVFPCLRRSDEGSMAGGVFVVVRAPDTEQGMLLHEKGIPTSPDGQYVMLHNPVHLLGMEAPVSILSACLLGKSTGGDDIRPRVDLVAEASEDLTAGTVMRIGQRHTIPGISPMLQPARPAEGANPIPYYMLTGQKLARDVPKGTVITCDMIQKPADSVLWDLRAEQDSTFLK